jgi:hypothetical protein
LDTVGSSREERDGLVDGGLVDGGFADAHGGNSCCWDPSLFGMILTGFSALSIVLTICYLTQN